MSGDEVAVACTLAAIGAEELPRHRVVVESLFGAVVERREDAEGYGFRLPPEPSFILLAAEFISRERLCCPFFRFALELEPAGGALWLRLGGPEGAKEVLRAGFADLVGVRA